MLDNTAESPRELDPDGAGAEWYDLDEKAATAREGWYRQTREAGLQLQFRYLRPCEMKEKDPGIIYLPWHMESMPDGSSAKFEDPTPQTMIDLLDNINAKLKDKKTNRSIGEDGDPVLQGDLMSVEYPKLIGMLIPWFTIRAIRAAGQATDMDNITWTKSMPLSGSYGWTGLNRLGTRSRE